MGENRRKDFLRMSADERNLIVSLSFSIKNEMKRRLTLRDLGMKESWDNIDLEALLAIPYGNLEKMLSQKRTSSTRTILRNLAQLHSIMGSKIHVSSLESTLDSWFGHANTFGALVEH